MIHLRDRFQFRFDEEAKDCKFYLPAKIRLKSSTCKRRAELGGYIPSRKPK
jgi:hypothetical protein